MGFGKGIVGILDLKDKIIQIYKNEDLQEVQLLSNLEDDWFIAEIEGEPYDWNLYFDGKEHQLTMYEVEETLDGFVTNSNNFVKIELKID